MTADSLQKELSKGWAMLVFQYHGKEGHVDPYDTRDENFSYLLWYDGDEKLVHSMEDVMHTPYFSTAILFPRSLVTSLKSTGADNNQIPRASLPIRAGALFHAVLAHIGQSSCLVSSRPPVRFRQTAPCSRHLCREQPSQRGGAYPAQDRILTANSVKTVVTPNERSFHHETRRCEEQDPPASPRNS